MSEPFLGEIRTFAFAFVPRGWALCSGQILPISNNQALFTLLQSYYGGDGFSSFGLPDLRGRIPIHMGRGMGLYPRVIGQRGGSPITNRVPAHTHGVSTASNLEFPLGGGKGTQQSATAGFLADSSSDVTLSNGTSGEAKFYAGTKGTQSLKGDPVSLTLKETGQHTVPNVHPSMVLNYCISMKGTYPVRN